MPLINVVTKEQNIGSILIFLFSSKAALQTCCGQNVSAQAPQQCSDQAKLGAYLGRGDLTEDPEDSPQVVDRKGRVQVAHKQPDRLHLIHAI